MDDERSSEKVVLDVERNPLVLNDERNLGKVVLDVNSVSPSGEQLPIAPIEAVRIEKSSLAPAHARKAVDSSATNVRKHKKKKVRNEYEGDFIDDSAAPSPSPSRARDKTAERNLNEMRAEEVEGNGIEVAGCSACVVSYPRGDLFFD